jgi:predicted N-acetyltransferase YhbS
MIIESFNIAKSMGYGAIFLWGNPKFYSKFGFVPTYRYNVRHIQFGNNNVDFIMVKELIEGTLNGIFGTIDIY